MARTLAFDRAEVIENARSVFWSKGFEATSVPELEAATGLSRSSIYNSFGSKRGLFDAAVVSYLEEIVRPRLLPLLADQVPASALTDYLQGLAAVFARPESLPAAHGCLLINTASAPLAQDSKISRIIGEYRAELQAAILRGVASALPEASAERAGMLSTAITGLVVASFALVRIAPQEAVRLLATAELLLAD
ncbi:TetR/AcrR family transcriptional regulator [Arthrobacter sp. MYb211]|uniref:TetR/AcrR family transcriptional regulator n=1 Tax=Micrococcaceae TaxID=1268 RepID=UPI000BB9A556|nr:MULTISPECIES: TetR/AcrR family transcriptional regulator [Micrococcaceae]PCC28248.1 TetR family transcriptional regulator [Glutamicibacter sp. BW80]PRA00992.1 TetR/AcrR family transcriptional regulator [Arthrobacter sp. MYb224]PRA13991.1 TetR/AcrR family transcriptional regulator [Arthrobacter sp. MYb221]PRC09362.1 TetR/AcrR family transcriptional regulator [Arthrobacter sp. MYb211]